MSKARHARTRRSRHVVRTLSIAGLGAGITAAGAGAAFATDYTVKRGDTLSEIAQAHGTDWHQLADLNDLRDPDFILTGQVLRLDGERRVSATPERRSRTEARHEKRANRKAPERTQRTSRSPRASGNGSANMSSAWRKVANCESSGNPRAVSPAGYYGLFQFDTQTWRSVGGSGNPVNASAGEQLMRAQRLYAQRGASPWPVCGRFLR